MKKKIGDLTLREVARMTNDSNCEDCSIEGCICICNNWTTDKLEREIDIPEKEATTTNQQ